MNTSQLKLAETFVTSDLNLATVLSLSFVLEGIDRTNPQRALFMFRRDQNLDRLIEMFWRKELRIEPQEYFQQLKIIKTRLYGNE